MADLSDEAMKQLKDQFEIYSEGAFQAKDFSNAISQVAQQVEKAVMNQSTYNSIIKTQLALEKTSLANIKRKNELHRQELSIYARLIPVLDATYRNNRRLAESQRQTISQLENYIDQMDRAINSERRRSDAIKEFGKALKDAVIDIAKFTLVLAPFAAGVMALKGIYNMVSTAVKELNKSLASTSKEFGITRGQMNEFGSTIIEVRSQWAAYGLTIGEVNEAQRDMIRAFYDTEAASNKALVSSTAALKKMGLSATDSAELVRSLSQQFDIDPSNMQKTLESFSGMITSGTSLSMVYRDMASSSSLFSLRNSDSLQSLIKMSEYAVRTGQSTKGLMDFADNLLFNSEDTFKNLGKLQSILKGRIDTTQFRGLLEGYAGAGRGMEDMQRTLLGYWDQAKKANKQMVPEVRRIFQSLFNGKTIEEIDIIQKNLKELDKRRAEAGPNAIVSFNELISASQTFDEQINGVLDVFATRFSEGMNIEEIEKGIQRFLERTQSFLNQFVPTFRELKEAFNFAGGQDNFAKGLVGAAKAFLRPIKHYWDTELKGKLKESWKEVKPVLKDLWEKTKPYIKDSLKWAWSETKPIMKTLADIFLVWFDAGMEKIKEKISVWIYENSGGRYGRSEKFYKYGGEEGIRQAAKSQGLPLTFQSAEDAAMGSFREGSLFSVGDEIPYNELLRYLHANEKKTQQENDFVNKNDKWLSNLLKGNSAENLTGKTSINTENMYIVLDGKKANINDFNPANSSANKGFGLIDWGGARAVGGVFNRPTLAMIGEEGRDEVVIPTGRIREGLPINSAVASQLSSIGVPGFSSGAVFAAGQYSGLAGQINASQAMYMQAGDPAQIRKREADMRAVNTAYMDRLKAYHREIFEKEKRLYQLNRRNFNKFGRDLGMFGRYTSLISRNLREMFKPGTIADAIGHGLAAYFESGKWEEGVRAAFDTAMKDNGWIYQNILEKTSNVTAEAVQSAYTRLRAWEEKGAEGGWKEAGRVGIAGYLSSLTSTRYSEGDYRGLTFGQRLGMMAWGQNPAAASRDMNSQNMQRFLQTPEGSIRQKHHSETLGVLSQIARNTSEIGIRPGSISGQGGLSIGGGGVSGGGSLLYGNYLIQKAMSVTPSRTQTPTGSSGGIGLRDTGLSSSGSSNGNFGLRGPGLNIGDGNSNTQYNFSNYARNNRRTPPPPPSLFSRARTGLGNLGTNLSQGFKKDMGSWAQGLPGQFGQAAIQGLAVGFETGDMSAGVDAAIGGFEQSALSSLMMTGPYGMAAGIGYMAFKGFMKNRSAKAKAKREKTQGRKQVKRDLGVGGSFHNAMKRTGMFPRQIPLYPPTTSERAFNTYMTEAEKSIEASIADVFGNYLSTSDIEQITQSYMATGSLDPVMADAYLEKIKEGASMLGVKTRTNALGFEVVDFDSKPGDLTPTGRFGSGGIGYASVQETGDVGGGIRTQSVNSNDQYRQHMNSSNVLQNDDMVNTLSRVFRESLNFEVQMDARRVGNIVTTQQKRRTEGL